MDRIMTQAPDLVECQLAIRMRNISKEFYGQRVLTGVDLDLQAGELHAILGENGAGKSTLCSILAGLYQATSGEISRSGEPFAPRSPHDALAAGIGMVYQHFRLVDQMTVAENILLGHPRLGARVSENEIVEAATTAMQEHGVSVDPRAYVGNLAVGEKQQVEIVRLLNRGVEVLILDEPTAVLTSVESDHLFVTLRRLADKGKVVVFVTHKLREISESADAVTVLRDGTKVADRRAADTAPHELARLMIGDELELAPERSTPRDTKADELLALRSVVVKNVGSSRPLLDDVNITVYRGEILGVAGVAGNGQRELAEAITGLRPIMSGSMTLNGRDITSLSTAERTQSGVGYIPEDRLASGLVTPLGLHDNVLLRSQAEARFRLGPLLRMSAVRAWARRVVEDFDIRGHRKGLPISVLSGGNLQRLIVGRELLREPKLIVASEPTRGLDVGAAQGVRELLLAQRNIGVSTLLISTDLEEILALADRVAVMYEGRIVVSLPVGEAEPETIARAMAGLSQ